MVLKAYFYQAAKEQVIPIFFKQSTKNNGRFMNLFWGASTILDTKTG